jgi:hypothetical protein
VCARVCGHSVRDVDALVPPKKSDDKVPCACVHACVCVCVCVRACVCVCVCLRPGWSVVMTLL